MTKTIAKTRIAATPERVADVQALVARTRGCRTEAPAGILAFSGRDDYLGFVAAWKVAYAGIVEDVRRDKRDRSAPGASVDARSQAQSRREESRIRARAALLLRAAGKELARQARVPRAVAA
jgi:hypothetical protein